MKSFRGLWVVAAVFSVSALAYILPGGSVVRRVADRRDELQLSSLTVQGTAVFLGDTAKEAAAALGADPDRPQLSAEATVYLKLPGRCRFEAALEESSKKVAAVRNGSRTRAEGSPVGALTAVVDQLCPLLAARSSSDNEARAALERHLTALALEYRKTALARFGGQVVYVLGNAAEGKPQFWVYKDSFLPARIRYRDAAGVAWDVRLIGYSSPATGEWFPRTIEVFKEGAPALRFTGANGDAKKKVDDALL